MTACAQDISGWPAVAIIAIALAALVAIIWLAGR